MTTQNRTEELKKGCGKDFFLEDTIKVKCGCKNPFSYGVYLCPTCQEELKVRQEQEIETNSKWKEAVEKLKEEKKNIVPFAELDKKRWGSLLKEFDMLIDKVFGKLTNQSPNKSEMALRVPDNEKKLTLSKDTSCQVQTGSDTQYNQVTLTYSDEDSFKKSQEKTK